MLKAAKQKNGKFKGASLIELVIAITILMIVMSAIVTMSIGNLYDMGRGEIRLQATSLAEGSVEAARSIRDTDWALLIAGTYGLKDTNGYWELSDTPDQVDQFTRSVTITDINAYTKEINVTVSWEGPPGSVNTAETTSRFSNWRLPLWVQTPTSGFPDGDPNGVTIDFGGEDGGGIILEPIADFRHSTVYVTQAFGGDGDIYDLTFNQDNLYVVTGNNNISGNEFFELDMSQINNGQITAKCSLDLGDAGKRVAVNDDYAFIAIDDKNKNVSIVRLSDCREVGTINAPGNEKVNGIFFGDNNLYVVLDKSSSGEFYAYDIPDPSHPPSNPSGSVELNVDANNIYVSDGYAYVVTDSDTDELQIIDLSNYTVVRTVDLPGISDATTVYVYQDTAYVGTKVNSEERPEFYVLNVTDINNITTIGSVEINHDVNDLFLDGNDMYVAAHREDTKDVLVINLTTFVSDGKVELAGKPEVKAIYLKGNFFYAGTDNNQQPLQILKGAVGDGQAGYATEGIFISAPFDNGEDGAVYDSIHWRKTGKGDVEFQIRVADTMEELADQLWIGPDGTSDTYYTLSGHKLFLPEDAGRWIQYKAVLQGDGVTTPRFQDIAITYGKK